MGHPGLTILGYHQVIEGTPDPVENFDGTMIGREAFTEQLAVLQKYYELVSLADWPRLQNQNETRRLLAITFDDGYADNATVAWPILRERRIPATFFITTGFVDGTLRPWSDRLRSAIAKTTETSLTLSELSESPIRIETQSEKINCLSMLFKHLKQLDDDAKKKTVADICRQCEAHDESPTHPAMSWNQLRQMVAEGADVGGHTVDHPILSRIGTDEVMREIANCKATLEQQLNMNITLFAYPNGTRDDFNADCIDAVARSGYELAVTTIPGINSGDSSSNLELRRIVINGNHSIRRVLNRLNTNESSTPSPHAAAQI